MPLTAHAITKDAVSAPGRQAGGTDMTFAHTTAAQSNRVLFVFCQIDNDNTGAGTVTGITYNGVAMTNITSVGDATAGSGGVYMTLYKLIAPATGTNNVVATLNGFNDAFIECAAETWYGVDQTTVNRTASTHTDGNTNTVTTSLTPTCSSGDVIIDAAGWVVASQGTITTGGSQTVEYTIQDGGANDAKQKGSSATSCVTMSWDWTVSGWTPSTQIAVAMIPVAAAGGPATGSLGLLGVGK